MPKTISLRGLDPHEVFDIHTAQGRARLEEREARVLHASWCSRTWYRWRQWVAPFARRQWEEITDDTPEGEGIPFWASPVAYAVALLVLVGASLANIGLRTAQVLLGIYDRRRLAACHNAGLFPDRINPEWLTATHGLPGDHALPPGIAIKTGALSVEDCLRLDEESAEYYHGGPTPPDTDSPVRGAPSSDRPNPAAGIPPKPGYDELRNCTDAERAERAYHAANQLSQWNIKPQP